MIASYLSRYFGIAPIPTKCIMTMLGGSMGSGIFYPLKDAVVQGAEITGIDIPVKIEKKRTNRVVMVLEQDPIRKVNDKNLRSYKNNFTTHGIVGIPNALHLHRSAYPQTQIYRDLIDLCHKKGYSVYISDVFKVYPSGLVGTKGRFGISEQQLLIDEINMIKPKKIIVTGAEAQSAFYQISGCLNKVPCPIIIPHLTGARASTWRKYGVVSATKKNKLDYIAKFF